MQHVKIFTLILISIMMTAFCNSQEIPIATGRDSTFGAGAAFDGTNFLLGILGDTINSSNITAQLLTAEGSLVGSRISIGMTGSLPMVAFDGTNYLMVWGDVFPMFNNSNIYSTGDIHGQFVSTSGNLVGNTFTIAQGVNLKSAVGRGTVVFIDTVYIVTYEKGGHHTDYLYGQRISRSGNPIGSPVQLSGNYAREMAMAFDGTNFLVTWVEGSGTIGDKDVYGQFLGRSGELVGTNFLIDGGAEPSDNPVAIAFDGSRYLVIFHEQAADSSGWNLLARFVAPSGEVSAERITIADSTNNPAGPSVAFDGTHYLASWMETSPPVRVMGRFFTTTGAPVDSALTLFSALEGKIPFGGVGGFIGGHYVLGATRIDSHFTDGDVYWKFLHPRTDGVRENEMHGTPKGYSLSQNYPNPFNPSTVIEYALPQSAHVTLSVYNSLGEQVALLADGHQQAGYHSVLFHGAGLASGVYFYTIHAGSFMDVKKILLMK